MTKRIILLLIGLLCLTGCTDKELKKVQDSHLELCSDYSIEDIANNYFSNISWSITDSSMGYKLYNLTGYRIDNDEKKEYVIQFVINEDNVDIKDFEINKMKSDTLSSNDLIKNMCKGLKLKKESVTKVLRNVDVQLIYNKEAFFVDENAINKNVDLYISGFKEDVDSIINSSPRVYIKLPSEAMNDYEAEYRLDGSYEDIDIQIEPKTTRINIEEVHTKVIKVDYELIKNEKTIKKETLSNEEIVVRGPERLLEKVISVKVKFDSGVEVLRANNCYQIEYDNIYAYDENNNEIDDVSFMGIPSLDVCYQKEAK